jgi:ABC-type sugar transport system substrate-binding protein
MKLIEFIKKIFWSDRNKTNIYFEAVAEGIKEAVEKLGYSMGLDDKP